MHSSDYSYKENTNVEHSTTVDSWSLDRLTGLWIKQDLSGLNKNKKNYLENLLLKPEVVIP
jgi:hypothetical protein